MIWIVVSMPITNTYANGYDVVSGNSGIALHYTNYQYIETVSHMLVILRMRPV